MGRWEYLKAFEAFEGELLGKVARLAGKANKRSKRDIIETITDACKKLGVQASKVSDKYFTYMRKGEKALKLGALPRKECKRCGGDGKVATGKGKATMEIKCQSCDGMGFTWQRTDAPMIKFWMSEEGKLVTTTKSYGDYNNSVIDPSSYGTEEISAYKLLEGEGTHDTTVALDNLGIVPSLTRVILKLKADRYSNKGVWAIGVIWKDNDGDYFFINDQVGEETTKGITGRKWKELGSKWVEFWTIGDKMVDAQAFIVRTNDFREDPYRYNGFDRSYYSSVVEKDDLKEADFMLAFDLGMMIQDADKLGNRKEVSKAREEARKGAAALIDPEQIKVANLQRYKDKISDVDLSRGIEGLIKKTSKLVGGKMFVVFAIEDNRGLETGFRYLIDDLIEYMQEGTEDNANKVKYRIASQFQKSIEAGKKWQSNKIEMMEALRSEFTTPAATEAFKALIGRLEEASAEISTTLFSKEYETIEDLSTITLVMESIDTALSNYKYGHIKLPKSILEVMRGNIDKAVLDAIEEWDKNDSFDESMKKIETVMRLIRRMV